jgi:hypothetical protein
VASPCCTSIAIQENALLRARLSIATAEFSEHQQPNTVLSAASLSRSVAVTLVLLCGAIVRL